MPSRRKRKRYRRRVNPRSEATAYNPNSDAHAEQIAGGLGGKFRPETRGDWRLVQKAANQDWPVDPAVAQSVCDAMGPAIETPDVRLFIAMAHAALAMDAANLRLRERLAH